LPKFLRHFAQIWGATTPLPAPWLLRPCLGFLVLSVARWIYVNMLHYCCLQCYLLFITPRILRS